MADTLVVKTNRRTPLFWQASTTFFRAFHGRMDDFLKGILVEVRLYHGSHVHHHIAALKGFHKASRYRQVGGEQNNLVVATQFLQPSIPGSLWIADRASHSMALGQQMFHNVATQEAVGACHTNDELGHSVCCTNKGVRLIRYSVEACFVAATLTA